MSYYSVPHFIAKFEAIPEEKWTTGAYCRGTQCCALGHCGVRDNFERGYIDNTAEGRELREYFRLWLGRSVSYINDRPCLFFPQTTPKQRVLAALHRIRELINQVSDE